MSIANSSRVPLIWPPHAQAPPPILLADFPTWVVWAQVQAPLLLRLSNAGITVHKPIKTVVTASMLANAETMLPFCIEFCQSVMVDMWN